MRDGFILTRRRLIGSSVVLGASGVTVASAALSPSHPRPPVHRSAQLLAQEFTVAAKVPTPDHYMHDPGMTRLGKDRIFVAAPLMGWRDKGVARRTRSLRSIVSRELLLSRSRDGGKSWTSLRPLPYGNATPFVHDGMLYMIVPTATFGTRHDGGNKVLLLRSDDEGDSWSDPVTLFEGNYWNCHTGMATAGGRLYWALTEGGRLVAIAADLSKDLMQPGTWQMSNAVSLPGVPPTLTRGLYPPKAGVWPVQWASDVWLEPNVVHVHGRLRVLLRTIIDEYATASLCSVCDLEDSRSTLKLSFTQFYPLPGGQNKFFILYDDVSRLFWMASNLVTDSQDFQNNRERLIEIGYHGGPGNERRLLFLSYSLDALNWFPAGCIAKWPSPLQSFMYPSVAVDGDDLVLISRTSNDAQNQHDADLVTFHRIQEFRSLALNLRPEI